jgi:L-asparagine permease
MTVIVDITAAALYMKYWGVFAVVPQWVFALIAMLIIGAVNLSAVGLFGEMEFWVSLVKVGALVLFLVVGVVFLVSGHHVAGQTIGLHLVAHGGVFPHGLLPAVVIVQGVVFAYAGIELVGIAAGEAADVKRVLPRAINSIITALPYSMSGLSCSWCC